mmetsp:Transcript_60661/g.162749  ORF Transcript_60661/g.162749 Transcript_60661/m.162749 type:complete len:249 (-) Transcript_60661:20-766(-)
MPSNDDNSLPPLRCSGWRIPFGNSPSRRAGTACQARPRLAPRPKVGVARLSSSQTLLWKPCGNPIARALSLSLVVLLAVCRSQRDDESSVNSCSGEPRFIAQIRPKDPGATCHGQASAAATVGTSPARSSHTSLCQFLLCRPSRRFRNANTSSECRRIHNANEATTTTPMIALAVTIRYVIVRPNVETRPLNRGVGSREILTATLAVQVAQPGGGRTATREAFASRDWICSTKSEWRPNKSTTRSITT